MQDERITSQDIEALVDGQLDPESTTKVRSALRRQPRLNSHYQRLMTQKQLLNQWWASLPPSETDKWS